MPPVYRFIEIIVYSLLNFLPFLALALYPFRHSLRFSRGVTGILIGLLSVIQVMLGAWVSFVPGNHAAICRFNARAVAVKAQNRFRHNFPRFHNLIFG